MLGTHFNTLHFMFGVQVVATYIVGLACSGKFWNTTVHGNVGQLQQIKP